MAFYPLNIDISGQHILVVGGGLVAERKVAMLLEFDAQIIVVAPEISPGLNELKEKGLIEWINRGWRPEDLDNISLAFAATNDPKVNKEIFQEAKERGVLLNCVDQPKLCSFIVPAFIKRGDLVIAISTGGASPALAAHIRRKLDEEFGEEYRKLTEVVGTIRKHLQDAGKSTEEYRDKFERLLSSDILEKIGKGDKDGIRQIVASIFGEEWL